MTNTCECHLIIQASYKSLERLSWKLETEIFPDAHPLEIEVESGVLYAHFWTAAPPIEAIAKLCERHGAAMISFTYCDRTHNQIGEYEPVFGHRPGISKGLAFKYQLEKSA